MIDKALTKALRKLRPTKPVTLEKHGECQITTSHPSSKEGTPTLKVDGIKCYLQEIQWKIHNEGKRIPEGKRITETCQTRGCLNPNHLAPLNHGEIIRARGKHKRGSANGRAKLTEEQAAIIKNSPQASASEIAKHFGISTSSVRDIWANINWAALVPPKGTPVFTPPPREEKRSMDEREHELQHLARTEYPNCTDLLKLGLDFEADFITPLLHPHTYAWQRNTPCWRLSTIGKIKSDLTPKGVDSYAAQLIVNTAGILHAEQIPGYTDWKEALQQPTILQNQNFWQSLTTELLAQPSKEKALQIWSDWLRGPKSAKHTALKAGIRKTLRHVLAQLHAELTKKQRQFIAAGGKKNQRLLYLHHTVSTALHTAEIKTLPEIALLSAREMWELGGFGNKTFEDMVIDLAEVGLTLRETPHEIELLSTSKAQWIKHNRRYITDAFWGIFYRGWWKGYPEYSTAEPYEKIRRLYRITSSEFSTLPGAQEKLEEIEKTLQETQKSPDSVEKTDSQQ